MFEITRFKYVDKNTHSKFEVFSREVDFADKLIERVNNLGVFNLRRAKIFFAKKCYTELAPLDIEKEQLETISKWEEKANEQEKSTK